MKVDIAIDLSNLNTIPEGTLALYFHEYIHFIQDITTRYGLMNLSNICYYIQYCAHNIEKEKKEKFDVPIKLRKRFLTNDNGFNNSLLHKEYIGTSINDKNKHISDLKYRTLFDKKLKIYKTILSFLDKNTGVKNEIQFGGIHICEGMAHLAEQLHFNDILEEGADNPYKLVELLADKIYPDIKGEKKLLIALCDISLMTYNPGYHYVLLLKELKNKLFFNNHSTSDWESIYKFGYTLLNEKQIPFDKIISEVKRELSNYFRAPIFDDTLKWIEFVLDQACKLRVNQPHFFMETIAQNNTTIAHQGFIKILNILGSPLVINGEDNATIALPNGFIPQSKSFMPQSFMGLNQILRIFTSSKTTQCILKPHCVACNREKPGSVIINNACDESQWIKALEVKLCPVAALWHHWALKKYAPNI